MNIAAVLFILFNALCIGFLVIRLSQMVVWNIKGRYYKWLSKKERFKHLGLLKLDHDCNINDYIDYIEGFGFFASEIIEGRFSVLIKVRSPFWRWKTKRVLDRMNRELHMVVPTCVDFRIEVIK